MAGVAVKQEGALARESGALPRVVTAAQVPLLDAAQDGWGTMRM